MKTALILSGGGSRGAFEVGALKVITKKLIPDMIIGTSVGSINSAKLADKGDIEENLEGLEDLWINAKKRQLFPINKEVFFKYYYATSLYSNKGLYKVIKKYLTARTFKELQIPLHINCTRLSDGKGIFFNKGNLIDPIVASCSTPIFLPPCKINGEEYIDGAFSSYFGVEKVLNMKFKQVIIIDPDYGVLSEHKSWLLNTANNSIKLIRKQLSRTNTNICNHHCKVIQIISDKKRETHFRDFSKTKELIKEGEKKAKKAIKNIKL